MLLRNSKIRVNCKITNRTKPWNFITSKDLKYTEITITILELEKVQLNLKKLFNSTLKIT